MTINKKLTINSAGKINLYLNVSKNLRPDGYHEIKSIMQSVSLYDELHFEVSRNYDLRGADRIDDDETSGSDGNSAGDNAGRSDGSSAWKNLIGSIKSGNDGNNGNPKANGGHRTDSDRLISEKSIMITCNNIDIPLNEKNLVHKAAHLVMKKFNLGKKYNIKINIEKQIPVGAGLAGGSTNAAATLLALDRLFNLKLSGAELIDIGNQVGSDVPFCISGGTALIEGKGEIISKLPDLPFYWVVLAINGKKFSSGDVYDKFDLVGKSKKTVHKNLVEKLANCQYDEFFTGLDNDLEKVVALEDRMVTILKNKAVKCGAFASMMTGSGPAIFAFCEDRVIAQKVYAGLGEISNKVYLTYTTPNSQNSLN
jgi:4-diphosphocytidyl-2-C-methyl-D-erythritol kinase